MMETPGTLSNDICPSNNHAEITEAESFGDCDEQPQTKRLKLNDEPVGDVVTVAIPSFKSSVLITDSSSCLYASSISSSTLSGQSNCENFIKSHVSDTGGNVIQNITAVNLNVSHSQAEKNDTFTHSNYKNTSASQVLTTISPAQKQDKDFTFPDVKTNFIETTLSYDINRGLVEQSQLHILSARQENTDAVPKNCQNVTDLYKNDVKQKTEKYCTEKINEEHVVEETTSQRLKETDHVNSQNMNLGQKVTDKDINKIVVSSKTLASDAVDVYDITEGDENSQPLTPLHKCKKVLQRQKDNPKSDETTTKKVSTDVESALCLKTRVAYMCSDKYISVCDEMLRVAGRAGMVHSLIQAYGLLKFMDLVPPRETTHEELLQFHTADYIQFLEKINQQEDEEKYDEEAEQYGLTYDCPVHVGVYDYAVLVAGATIRAAELLVDGSCDVAMNWGGGWHHAKRDTASGFCYFNDIALGILKLREKFDKVLYVDIDLHHGDGVEDAFCTTSKVLTVSFHKYLSGFFPGTGSIGDVGMSKGRHYTVNVPLLDGIKDAEFFALFNRVMSKVRERFKPEAIVCQCGADGLAGDPMESFNLTPLGLGRCVHTLQNWKIPLLLLGGGGYNFVNTAKCWTFITSLVLGRKLPDDIPDHKFFMEYGPDYELGVSVGNRKDHNSREYLGKVYRQVMENLNHIV